MVDPQQRGTGGNRATGARNRQPPSRPRPTGLYRVDFYDRVHPHLKYLGRLTRSYKSNVMQRRLIDRADLVQIFNSNRTAARGVPSDLAVSLPGSELTDKLFPGQVGLIGPGTFDHEKIERQSRSKSHVLQVTRYARQEQQLAALFAAAKKSGVEEGLYIMLKINKTGKKFARLRFWPGVPLEPPKEDEYVFCMGTEGRKEDEIVGSKIRYACTSQFVRTRDLGQVIGTVHTHYLKRKAFIDARRTQTGTTVRMGRIRVVSPEVSPTDRHSAKDDEIVVYATEGDKRHKAMPDGRAYNNLPGKFNLLVDALESFAGKRPPVSGRPA